jgi:hypothetical protein
MKEALQGEIQDRFCYVELCISRQRVVDACSFVGPFPQPSQSVVPMHVQYFSRDCFTSEAAVVEHMPAQHRAKSWVCELDKMSSMAFLLGSVTWLGTAFTVCGQRDYRSTAVPTNGANSRCGVVCRDIWRLCCMLRHCGRRELAIARCSLKGYAAFEG